MSVNTTRPKKADIARAETAIVKLTERFPEVTEEGPWGHRAFKVRGKTFLFLVADGDGLSFSVKLPRSGAQALKLPYTEPTHYGLGKSGWVSAKFASGADVPLARVAEWLEESYGAIAPKRLLAVQPKDGAKRPAPRAAKSAPAKRRAAKKRSPVKAAAPKRKRK
jgi:predicted DNA-binding protein (MmcQ/YjbR family)